MSNAFKNDPAPGNNTLSEALPKIIFKKKVNIFNSGEAQSYYTASSGIHQGGEQCSLALKTHGTEELLNKAVSLSNASFNFTPPPITTSTIILFALTTHFHKYIY